MIMVLKKLQIIIKKLHNFQFSDAWYKILVLLTTIPTITRRSSIDTY